MSLRWVRLQDSDDILRASDASKIKLGHAMRNLTAERWRAGTPFLPPPPPLLSLPHNHQIEFEPDRACFIQEELYYFDWTQRIC